MIGFQNAYLYKNKYPQISKFKFPYYIIMISKISKIKNV